MPELVIDVMQSLERHLEHNTKAIAALVRAVQQREADKTPSDWRPYTILVSVPQVANPGANSPASIQIARKEPKRYSMGIQLWSGGDDLLFSNTPFDDISILQQFSDPINPVTGVSANQVVNIGYLAAGGAIVVRTTGPIYAINVPASASAPLGAMISMVELLYASSNQQPVPGGQSGLQLGGYDSNGNKGLR